MKIHIDIDNWLLAEAMQFGEWPTREAAINEALAIYVRSLKRAQLAALKGKVIWCGDLDELRDTRKDIA
jgi:Arc/MetJ family transcription regulator